MVGQHVPQRVDVGVHHAQRTLVVVRAGDHRGRDVGQISSDGIRMFRPLGDQLFSEKIAEESGKIREHRLARSRSVFAV